MNFCPKSWAIWLGLQEKSLPFHQVFEVSWQLPRFLHNTLTHNSLPILRHDNFFVFSHIDHYLQDIAPTSGPDLWGQTPQERNKIHTWKDYFLITLYRDITLPLIYEKVFSDQRPKLSLLKEGYANLKIHLKFLNTHLNTHPYLAEENTLTWADLFLGAHLLILDYLGDISWPKYPHLKEWYSRFKSRPACRPMLRQTLAHLRPSKTYKTLDF